MTPDKYDERNCRDACLDDFYPDLADNLGVAYAKSMCSGCPIKSWCLQDALANESGGASYRHGIFAGLTGPERAAYVRSNQPARKRAVA